MKDLKWAFVILSGLVLLVFLSYVEQNWRGKSAWKTYNRQLKARGGTLDWNDYIPPPVPDDQKFFKAPKMQEWFQRSPNISGENELAELRANPDTYETITNTERAMAYLSWSDQFEGDFDLIRNALKRPYTRLDGNYSNPGEMPMVDFTTMRSLSQALAQRAKCYLLLNEPDKALAELTLLNGLAASPKNSPPVDR